MESYSRATRIMGVVERISAWVGAIACVLMMALVVANVILRFVWQSIPGTLDVTESFMVVITVMMLAYTQARRGHVNVEYFTNYFPLTTRRAFDLLALILALGFTLFLTWQSWKVAALALSIQDASGTYPYIPFYPAKLLLAIGISVLCLQLIFDVWQGASKLFRKKPQEPAVSS